MNLFNLPNSILIKIYEYDNTYQEILRKLLKIDLNKTIINNYTKTLDIYKIHILNRLLLKISRNPSNKVYKDEIRFFSGSNGSLLTKIKNVVFTATICNKEDYEKYIKNGMDKEDFDEVGKNENLRYITMSNWN